MGWCSEIDRLYHRRLSTEPRVNGSRCHVGVDLGHGAAGARSAAARALAGLGIRELAAAAGVTPRTLHRLENGGVVHVSEKKRHGHLQRAVWERIMAALATAGVELLASARIDPS